ncbi:MAG: lysylphosphatidylglycerol synthase transmembrane domain-containing protein [Pseudomonadales bacterium]|jgi:uncharacterized membrane protein YbhN (UPF0104 family)|nr:lysylphosphatidylglycerol synthase transmembrane domain-containing protein [Pseudomonadales bacterium]
MPRPLVRAAQIAVALCLLVLLWTVSDGAAALGHLAGAHPGWLAAALVTLTAQTVLSALRWRLTAGQLGITLGRGTALKEYYLAQIVNQALPGGVLGDAGRAVRARAQAGLVASSQAVLLERLAGQIALFILFGAAVAGTLVVSGGFDWPAGLLAPVALFLCAGFGLVLLLGWVGPRAVGPGRPIALGRPLTGFAAAFQQAVAAPEVRMRQALMSLGTALCTIAAFAFCAAAVGVVLPPATALVLVPLILFTMLIPVTVSGWGLREGAAVALFPLAGATAAEGLAASVAFGLAFLVATLPGLVALGVAPGPRPVKS